MNDIYNFIILHLLSCDLTQRTLLHQLAYFIYSEIHFINEKPNK